VDGNEWMNRTTLWRMEYEYADLTGGGWAVDSFKTPNRYTPPSGPQIQNLESKRQLKNGRSRSLPLHPQLRAVLETRSQNTKHVFPGNGAASSTRFAFVKSLSQR
jgi:hypothetical protein